MFSNTADIVVSLAEKSCRDSAKLNSHLILLVRKVGVSGERAVVVVPVRVSGSLRRGNGGS
jgi:hypothetical protein